MWPVFLKIHLLLQRLRPMTIVFSPERQRFEERPHYTFYFGDFNLMLLWIAGIYGMKNSLTSESSSDGDPNAALLSVLNGVLTFLLFVLFNLGTGGAYTMRTKKKEMAWILNQAHAYNIQREKEIKEARRTKKKGERPTLQEILFEALVPSSCANCFFGAFLIFFTPLLMKVTPAHYIFSWIIPSDSAWATVFYCFYLGMNAFFQCIQLIQGLMCICGVLYTSSFILKPSYQTFDERNPGGREEAFTPANNNNKWVALNFERARKIYLQGYLFIRDYNAYGTVTFLMYMITGASINIVATFTAIKFKEVLPPPLLGFFIVFDFVVLVLTYGLYKFTMIPLEECERFQKYWRVRLFGKMIRRKYKACRPIAIEIGQFFKMQHTSFLNAMMGVVDQTVSLLIIDG